MSWQADLKRYMDLRDEIALLESREGECTCDSNNFHRCGLHDEITERCIESNRLKDLWADLWACKLWRISQYGETATRVYFGKEPPCTTAK